MTAATKAPFAWWATAPLPGAIGILHLEGPIEEVLLHIAERVPPVGTTTLASLASIDQGVIARTTESSALLMPHGGPRIRKLLTRAVVAAGADFIDPEGLDPQKRWPEADNLVEACMLDALARTGSPRALQLLLQQPKVHADAHAQGKVPDQEDLQRAQVLDRLIDPPLIAIVGAPNVGKSTLLNQLAGRDVAITANLAGTTRDTVTARVELDGLSCDVVDLPGKRTTTDPIEGRALELAQAFVREADMVIALVDPEHPDVPNLNRTPELTVCNKSDLGATAGHMQISALNGTGLDSLAVEIRRTMIPDEFLSEQVPFWIFHPALAPGT